VRRGEIQRVLPHVLDMATAVPILGDDRVRAEVEVERDELLTFYRAALQAYGGNAEAAVATLREALQRDPDNPYYRWVSMGRR
jgi:spermidine synthase